MAASASGLHLQRIVCQHRLLMVSRQLTTSAVLCTKKYRAASKRRDAPTDSSTSKVNVLSKLSAIAMKVSHQDKPDNHYRTQALKLLHYHGNT